MRYLFRSAKRDYNARWTPPDPRPQSPFMDAAWNANLEHAVVSDVGMRRANNQDSAAVVLAGDEELWRRRGHVFVVADGMGAHAAGELASKMAADGIPHNYHKINDQPPVWAIAKAVEEINDQINQRVQANIDFQGMGTTSSVLVLLPQGAVVAHVGDSRVYRLRGDTLEQLTFDHSLLWEMRAAGQLDPESLATFVPKNIITRSLGPHPHVQVDLEGPFPLEVGDTFMLCSDGLTGQVRDEEIGAILRGFSPQEATRALVDLANLRGGPDNITVIAVRVTAPLSRRAEEPLAVKTGNLADARHVSPLVWGAAVVAGAAAGGLAYGGMMPWALGASFVAVLAATMGIVKRYGAGVKTLYLRSGSYLGKGPHVTCDAKPNQHVAEDLAHVIDQLQQSATGETWQAEGNGFQDLARQGRAAAGERDYSRAVHLYVQAMMLRMDELRRRKAANAPVADSEEVDL